MNLSEGSDLQTRTLHSWAGIGLGKDTKEKLFAKVMCRSKNRKLWQKTDILIIDEVSMLGKSLFEKLDYIGRQIRQRDYLPFGGLQLIFSGDYLQLPPIRDTFIFESSIWDEMFIQVVPFITPKRYNDPAYFDMLLRIRKGNQTQQDINTLHQCVLKYDKLKQTNNTTFQVMPTILHSRRIDVSTYNNKKLKKLTTKQVIYKATDSFIKLKSKVSKEYYQKLLNDSIPERISLKPGSQVMLKVNLDVSNGLVNGSRGVVTECDKESVVVKFRNGKDIRIAPHTWEIKDDSMKSARTQIPLILAWSLTIHRIQGSTLDCAVCNLGQSIFEKGQAYVALSRVRNLDGLYLTNFYEKAIQVNKKALEFDNEINSQSKPMIIEKKVNYEPMLIVEDSDTEEDMMIDIGNKNKNYSEDNECIICMDNPKNATLVHGDCGHTICCMDCARTLKKCPVCRKTIEKVLRNFQ